MATSAEMAIVIKARDQASGVLAGLEKALHGLGSAATAPIRGFASLASGVTNALGKIGLAAMGLDAIASSARGLGNSLGVGLLMEMEDTRAQFMAFYKDAGLVDKTLADLRAESSARRRLG